MQKNNFYEILLTIIFICGITIISVSNLINTKTETKICQVVEKNINMDTAWVVTDQCGLIRVNPNKYKELEINTVYQFTTKGNPSDSVLQQKAIEILPIHPITPDNKNLNNKNNNQTNQ